MPHGVRGRFLENGMTRIRLHLHIYGISIFRPLQGGKRGQSIHIFPGQIHRGLRTRRSPRIALWIDPRQKEQTKGTLLQI